MAMGKFKDALKDFQQCGCFVINQIIWDEVGETESERDRTIIELERECLEVYRRKVDQANKNRAQLRQAISDAEAELAIICAAMVEIPVHLRQGILRHGLTLMLPLILIVMMNFTAFKTIYLKLDQYPLRSLQDSQTLLYLNTPMLP